jgi:hypothetical protein
MRQAVCHLSQSIGSISITINCHSGHTKRTKKRSPAAKYTLAAGWFPDLASLLLWLQLHIAIVGIRLK